MKCRICDLRDKEVISIIDGTRIGFISDAEIDTKSAELAAIIVYGKPKFFGLLGREADCVIPWKDIKLIGDDTVLVDCEAPGSDRKRGALADFFDGLLG